MKKLMTNEQRRKLCEICKIIPSFQQLLTKDGYVFQNPRDYMCRPTVDAKTGEYLLHEMDDGQKIPTIESRLETDERIFDTASYLCRNQAAGKVCTDIFVPDFQDLLYRIATRTGADYLKITEFIK